tara:strand:+ start:357 stop:734 length:378 start_codon:yes stop_codon:yes gene_type:complete
MKYAKVVNGAIAKIPYTLEDLRNEAPNTSFPKNSLSNADIQGMMGIVEVVDAAIDAETNSTSSAGEVKLVDGVWTQTWDYTLVPYDVKRKEDYGDPYAQIEFITENGLEAWQAKVAQIKIDHPKP